MNVFIEYFSTLCCYKNYYEKTLTRILEFAFIFTSQNINRNQSCPNELPILLSNDILSIFTKAHVDWRLSGLV